MADLATVLLGTAGAVFFLAGTVGLLRFPDLFCRLHALTKADNLGLGLVVLALLFQVESWPAAGKLLLIWAVALLAGSTGCYAIGHFAREKGECPGKEGTPDER
ncbi:MAG: monovalent cation/H(+) antiporter subunit G [Opitutales bacterium]|nr:monovalent cation/H(+) antiporter subunit G [Opitutales bacterium]MCH8540035.1 monovalent cation/H(+) antiporter subunit G [Opitutales bacterium]